MAKCGPIAKAVATHHANRIQSRIHPSTKVGTESDVVKLCTVGWHRGEAYMRKPWKYWSAETKDYADRVWNVYQDLDRREAK